MVDMELVILQSFLSQKYGNVKLRYYNDDVLLRLKLCKTEYDNDKINNIIFGNPHGKNFVMLNYLCSYDEMRQRIIKTMEENEEKIEFIKALTDSEVTTDELSTIHELKFSKDIQEFEAKIYFNGLTSIKNAQSERSKFFNVVTMLNKEEDPSTTFITIRFKYNDLPKIKDALIIL